MRDFIRSSKSIRARGRRVAGAPSGDARNGDAGVEQTRGRRFLESPKSPARLRPARWGLTALLVVGALLLGHAWAPTIHAAGPLTVSDCSSEYGSGGTQASPAAGSLLAAVNQANTDNAGDPISITCSGTIPLTSTLTITGSMSISGPTGSSPAVALDGGATAQPARVVQDLVVQTGANLTLTDLSISGGTASNGGGIDNQAGAQLTLNSDAIAGNAATGGGGIENAGGTLNVTNSTFTGNVANGNGNGSGGGAIENAFGGQVTITGSAFTSNTANNGAGGAIENDPGFGSSAAASTLSISGSTFTGNSAVNGGPGGAIANYGSTATITTSTLSGNSAAGGGGIYDSQGTVNVTSSTLAQNTSSGLGGGLASTIGSTVTVASSTFAYNTASTIGGGIYVNSPLTLTNSTVASNTAGVVGNGGGIDIDPNSGTSPTMAGNILADNRAGGSPNNCLLGNPITDRGYNLESGADCGFAGTGSLQNTDPLFVTDGSGNPQLANNGGPTQTIALQSSSPAIDKIPSATTTLCQQPDQRGTTRPDNGEANCDIGAYEYVDPSDADLGLTGVPANQTVNATSPQGAVVTYTPPTATDESGDNPAATVSCARSDHPATASAPFPIGTTTVTCTASDNDDTNSPVHASFTVKVLGAADQVSNLLATVNGYTNPALTATQKTTLDNKLNEILAEINGGQKALACSNLSGFISYVKAQTGKGGVTAARATALIAAGKNIQAVLGC